MQEKNAQKKITIICSPRDTVMIIKKGGSDG
jgi:hypothetical protein